MESRKRKATSSEPEQQSLLHDLPAELVSALFDWLPLIDLLRLACTCRALSLALDDDGYWRRRARRMLDGENDGYLLRFTPQRTWRSLCRCLLLPPKLSVSPPRISPAEFLPSVAWLGGRLYLGCIENVYSLRMPGTSS
eukprot:TRINITY_DN4941_c0_g1_i2.p2 TRINITY_DN4941_c0_g1~~TRINITY_DN4941_c0_g1_i2.p2  ORF type:complete len:139 (+),score=22.99 TRINITY_DN4941_c0_g1_i2:224-640(+)